MEETMRRGLALLAAVVAVLCAGPAAAQIVKLQGVWDGSANTYQEIEFDALTGWPVVECAMSDGAGNPIGSTGGALNVSVAALPLPAGAATAAKQDAQTALLTTIDADTGALAANSATAALQTAGNISLATIAGDTTSIDARVATEATLAVVETNTDFGTVTGGGVEASALRVTIASDSTGVLSVDDNGGSLTVDGMVGVGNGPGALAVNVQDGGNSITVDGTFWPTLGQALMAASLPVVIASNQSTVPVSTATGSVVDSALAPQDTLWRNVADGGATADANKGVIPAGSIVAGTVVKLYQVPTTKQYHEVSITQTDSDANAFEWMPIVYALNDIPSAAWALNDYLSVGALVVPTFKVSRDRTKTVVAQPLIQTRASYLLVIVNAVTVAPAGNPRVRIISYNDGDAR